MIVADIGDAAMTQISTMLEELEYLKTKTRTLLQTNPVIQYKAVRENLLLYKTDLDGAVLEFKRELRQLLPQIRGKKNGKSESDLLTMLNQYKSSPFEKSKSLEKVLNER